MQISIIKLKRAIFIFSLLFLSCWLCGCKEEVPSINVFYGLPESRYLSEFTSALEEKKPVVVSFTAKWCPHCRKYEPIFFEVGAIYENKVKFLNIDIEDPEGEIISKRFQVQGIPTTAFIRKDGSVFKVQVGGIEKLELASEVNKLIKSKRRKKGQPIAPFPIE